jgi:hypothetical protein
MGCGVKVAPALRASLVEVWDAAPWATLADPVEHVTQPWSAVLSLLLRRLGGRDAQRLRRVELG